MATASQGAVMMRRALIAIAALLTAWLGVAPISAALTLSAATAATHTYDAPVHLELMTDDAAERGPPATYDHANTDDAVDLGLHDASARHAGAAPGSTTTYTTPAEFAQGTSVTTWTGSHAVVVDGEFSSLQPTDVAANAGDDLTRLYRAVDPAELKDIVGTGVYRSAPGGTEGKYFFPTKEQAEHFSNLMGKTGTGPYCITSGCIPRSTLKGIETIHPAGEGTAYFIPQNLLSQFRDIITHAP